MADYSGFPSKNQFLKARVPAARLAARRDTARPDQRQRLLGLIAGGLALEGAIETAREAERLLSRYEAENRSTK